MPNALKWSLDSTVKRKRQWPSQRSVYTRVQTQQCRQYSIIKLNHRSSRLPGFHWSTTNNVLMASRRPSQYSKWRVARRRLRRTQNSVNTLMQLTTSATLSYVSYRRSAVVLSAVHTHSRGILAHFIRPAFLVPFHGAIAVPSVTRCRCRRWRRGHRCAGGVQQYSSDTWWIGVRRLVVANGPNIFQMLFFNLQSPVQIVFTARRYASAVYAVAVCLSVCVCLSHSGIVSKRLNVGLRK